MLPSPADSSGRSTVKSTASELEHLSRTFIEVPNRRDFEFRTAAGQEILRQLAPDFRAQVDTNEQQSAPITFTEQVLLWKQRARDHPDVHFEILHVSSDLDENRGKASVYLEMEVTGIGDVRLGAMNRFDWRKVGTKWMCYYALGMRGSRVGSGLA